jgi:phosphatidate cytidylyltransferase
MAWLVNPLTNHLFVPFTILLLTLLGSAACMLFIVQQLRLRQSENSLHVAGVSQHVLWQRYRIWTLIGVLFVVAAFCGSLVMAALCVFLCWQGAIEYAALTGLPPRSVAALVLCGLLTCVGVLVVGPVILSITPILAFFIWSLLALQPAGQNPALEQRFSAGLNGLWGYLYLGWLPVYLLALSGGKQPGLVLSVGLGVALSDVGAFCAGKTLGGPKLAPQLSPGKTWGGVLGNILGAALALALTAYALPGWQLWQIGLLALTIALGSVWGDLLESLLKRQHGVKDAGAFLPGFGGLLDRIDSLLIVAPLVYYVSCVLMGNSLL